MSFNDEFGDIYIQRRNAQNGLVAMFYNAKHQDKIVALG